MARNKRPDPQQPGLFDVVVGDGGSDEPRDLADRDTGIPAAVGPADRVEPGAASSVHPGRGGQDQLPGSRAGRGIGSPGSGGVDPQPRPTPRLLDQGGPGEHRPQPGDGDRAQRGPLRTDPGRGGAAQQPVGRGSADTRPQSRALGSTVDEPVVSQRTQPGHRGPDRGAVAETGVLGGVSDQSRIPTIGPGRGRPAGAERPGRPADRTSWRR